MPLLDIKNLNVRFGDATATPVVDGLSLSVDKGEVLAIVGESGSGKSVTMMALMGLIDHPGIVTADALSFDGKDMLKLNARQRRQIVGKDLSMVFQDPMTALNPSYTVVFQIKVNKVEGKQLPEVDAEFMKGFGVDDGDEAKFKAEVRKNMERELDQTIKNKVKEQVVDALVKGNEFDVPKALINNEIDALRQQAVQQFGGPSNFDASQLPAELFQEQAEKRVKLGLLMASVVEAKEIKADEAALRAYVEKLAESYQDPDEVVDYYMSNDQMRQQLESAVLEELVVENLLSEATVNDVEMSYDDAIKPAAPQQEEAEEAAE